MCEAHVRRPTKHGSRVIGRGSPLLIAVAVIASAAAAGAGCGEDGSQDEPQQEVEQAVVAGESLAIPTRGCRMESIGGEPGCDPRPRLRRLARAECTGNQPVLAVYDLGPSCNGLSPKTHRGYVDVLCCRRRSGQWRVVQRVPTYRGTGLRPCVGLRERASCPQIGRVRVCQTPARRLAFQQCVIPKR